MKFILALVIGFACFSAPLYSQKAQASEAQVVPLEVCCEIIIITPSSWYLRFKPNGSAVLGYGAVDSFELPAHTFCFKRIHKKLSALKFGGEGSSSDDPSVAFLGKTGTANGLSTSDRQVIKDLFQETRSRAKELLGWNKTPLWNSTRLPEIWAKNPPMTGL